MSVAITTSTPLPTDRSTVEPSNWRSDAATPVMSAAASTLSHLDRVLQSDLKLRLTRSLALSWKFEKSRMAPERRLGARRLPGVPITCADPTGSRDARGSAVRSVYPTRPVRQSADWFTLGTKALTTGRERYEHRIAVS